MIEEAYFTIVGFAPVQDLCGLKVGSDLRSSFHHHCPYACMKAFSMSSMGPRNLVAVAVALALPDCLYRCQELAPALTYNNTNTKSSLATPS